MRPLPAHCHHHLIAGYIISSIVPTTSAIPCAPHLSPLAEGRAPVKLGALCRRSRRGRG
jgi:hypothetical protein